MMTDETFEVPASAPKAAPRKKAAAARDRVKIVVHPDGSPGAESEIFVGVNGVGYRIKRGEEVSVPRSVVTVLEESVRTIYEHVRRDDGSSDLVPRDVPTYPFSVKG